MNSLSLNPSTPISILSFFQYVAVVTALVGMTFQLRTMSLSIPSFLYDKSSSFIKKVLDIMKSKLTIMIMLPILISPLIVCFSAPPNSDKRTILYMDVFYVNVMLVPISGCFTILMKIISKVFQELIETFKYCKNNIDKKLPVASNQPQDHSNIESTLNDYVYTTKMYSNTFIPFLIFTPYALIAWEQTITLPAYRLPIFIFACILAPVLIAIAGAGLFFSLLKRIHLEKTQKTKPGDQSTIEVKTVDTSHYSESTNEATISSDGTNKDNTFGTNSGSTAVGSTNV